MLAEDVGRLYPSTKVLLISGLPFDMLTERGLISPEVFAGGRVHYKQKPFSNQELLAEVDRILKTKVRLANATS